ncbi:MAG: L,D-transpeptidase [Rhizobiaceae bacterium]|nr:L,D-transpeptidase [Rhizobiaceae bacterium]
MLFRSLLAAGLSAALTLCVPAISNAQTKKPQVEEQVAPKSVKKKKVEKKSSSRNQKATSSAKAKGKVKPAENVAKNDKPKGLLAVLFGGQKAKSTKQDANRVGSKPIDDSRRAKLAPLNPISPVQLVSTDPVVADVVANGNNGELRSEKLSKGGGFMASLFGEEDQYLPQTRALDSAYHSREAKKKFQVKPEFQPQIVSFSGYPAGTIVIDTANHFLYYVESLGKARRYGIAVGKDGLQYKGNVRVGDKQEWPRWIPTKEMQEREPQKYGQYKDGMPGGGQNPLGARAIYLYDGKKDTHLRIHGTIAPQTIGTNSSNGCFRMVNEHVIDLYRRVKVGTNVVVL